MGHRPVIEFNVLVQILQALIQKSDKEWRLLEEGRPGGNDRLKEDYEELLSTQQRMIPDIFDKISTRKSLQLRLNDDEPTRFYLPPIKQETGYIPIFLSEFDLENCKANLRLELHSFKEGKHHAIGFRFESPTGKVHNYFHVQLNNKIRPGGGLLPDCPPWLPTTIPCIPTEGKNLVSLLKSLIISLYGESFWNELVRPLGIPGDFR